MKHNRVPRFTHTFVIYEADALPRALSRPALRRRPAAEPRGDEPRSGPTAPRSRPRTSAWPCRRRDPWFRPVDIKLGPDGALYIADWYDRQVNHYRNHEGQIDPGNGRIYRLKAARRSRCRQQARRSRRD